MGIKDILMDGETLIKNEEVFSPEYLPEKFGFRDSQLKSMAMNLKPALKGGKPVNTLLLGPCGTGKTSSLKIIFLELEEYTNNIVTVYVNCQFSSTPFQVFSLIYKKIFGHLPPETGVPLSRIQDSIFRKLGEKALVVALDDIEYLFYLQHGEKILYEILRAYEKYENATTSVFGVLSDNNFRIVLAKKVSTIFNPQEILFPPYTQEETFEILSQRRREGLVFGCMDDEVLEYIAEKSFEMGDLRVGIDLMYRSALQAEEEASKKILKKHVMQCLKNTKTNEIFERLMDDEKTILEILKENGGEMNSGKLYKEFNKKTRHREKKYSQIISKLEFLRLIDTVYEKRVGRSRKIVLRSFYEG